MLCNISLSRGEKAKYFFFPSMKFGPHRLSKAKDRIRRVLGDAGLMKAQNKGHFYLLPSLDDIVSLRPQKIVLTFPQEYRRHPADAPEIHIPDSEGRFETLASLKKLEEDVGPLQYNRLRTGRTLSSYFDNVSDMLMRLRKALPDVPIILVKRLSHLDHYGPNPFSWLHFWANGWREGYERIARLQRHIGLCHVIDYDKIMASMISSGRTVNEFTGMTFFIDGEGSDATLRIGRDLEHLHPRFLADAYDEIQNPTFEPLPASWPPPWGEELLRQPSQAESLPAERLLPFSGAAVPFARSFLSDNFPIPWKNITMRLLVVPFCDAQSIAVREIDEQTVMRYLGDKRKVVLYGAGGRGRQLLAFLQETAPTCEILGFIDSNPKLVGSTVAGLTVYDLQGGLATGAEVIIPASYAIHEISEKIRMQQHRLDAPVAIATGIHELFTLHCFSALREVITPEN